MGKTGSRTFVFLGYFLDALQSNNIYFTFFRYFWPLSRAHFNRRLVVWPKLGLSRAHNKFMPANTTFDVLLEIKLITNRNLA